MRPRIHYRPEKNWINDPNGLCQADGWYHLFYQYNPHGSVWGDMHWGHARSRDMYRWETLPVAMAPDGEAGEIHCFSGSCCKDREGRLHFFYTSIGRDEAGRGVADGAEQWTAVPVDAGMTRLRQTREGALTDAVHGGMHVRDWRDPCVIPYGGEYLMVLGGCADGRGCVLLYTSPDMRTWTFRHILLRSDIRDDVPWECPNLMLLDGRAVLFWSPCAQVQYAVGTLDADLHLQVERTGVLDPAGRDGYYAPQAFRDEAGRTLLMGWMPECDGDEAAIRRGWSGVMSLPRLLSVRDGDLDARPLPGWEALVGPGSPVSADTPIRAGRHWILHGTFDTAQALTVCLLADAAGQERTVLTWSPEEGMILDRSASTRRAGIATAPVRREMRAAGRTEMFLCVDGTALEWMTDGCWTSGRVYPTGEEVGWLTIRGDVRELKLYPIV